MSNLTRDQLKLFLNFSTTSDYFYFSEYVTFIFGGIGWPKTSHV